MKPTAPHILPFPSSLCENCGSRTLERFTIPGISEMLHCPHCDLYQKGQVASAEDYKFAYHRGYAAVRGRKLRNAAIRLSRLRGRLDVERPRLLDVGCSLGCTVEAAGRMGWDAHGVDISQDAVEFCRGQGLNCQVMRPSRLPYADNSFDALTAWHVIEHVPDVADALREWRRVLRPGGVLALETPDASCLKVRLWGARYRHFWAAEHVYTFRPENLIPFLKKAGFEVLAAPRPQLRPLGVAMAAYGIGYETFTRFMAATSLNRAFAVFCRRPSQVDAIPLGRAA